MNKLNRKLFNIYDAIDNDASFPYSIHKRKPIRIDIRELSNSEIPISLKDSIPKNIGNKKVSIRIQRAVRANNEDEEKITCHIEKVPDSYSMRAFKEYLYKEKIYDVTQLDDIPRLSERPNSMQETIDITPRVDYSKTEETFETS